MILLQVFRFKLFCYIKNGLFCTEYDYIRVDNERQRRGRSLPGPRSITYIDTKGGKIEVNDPKIVLTIPPDSLPRGVIKEITLGLCWTEDYPPIEPDQMVMGPILRCGPDGIVFDKDVHLEMTCAMLDLKLKFIQVWCNERSIGK